jgi:hypothetical protein
MDVAMDLIILLFAGVNFGWQPAAGSPDGYEYIVQVEPELLDALRSGDSVPIESNVPPDVGPIRKVSLVVGRGDLPRHSISAVQRTAYFAGQSSWAPDGLGPPPASTSAPTTPSAYDRYAPPTNTPPPGVAPPPGVLDRAQAAVTETGTALSDGLEAGIQAANQQFSQTGEQMLDAARNAGQEFGRQLQGMANDSAGQLQSNANQLRSATEQAVGNVGNQLQPAANPFAVPSSQAAPSSPRTASNVAPPPWPPSSVPVANASGAGQSVSPTTSPVRSGSAWTMIDSRVAPPPLIIPQLATTATNTDGQQPRATGGGPSFPPSGDLTDGWGTGRAGAPATIGREGTLPSSTGTGQSADLVPVERVQGQNATASQPAANGWDDLWSRDPWGQTPPTSPPGQLSQDPRNNMPAMRDAAAEWQTGTNSGISPPSLPANQMQSGVTTSPGTVPADPRVLGSQAPPPTTTTAEQPPWLPLLIVSLSLVGSLSANLFLGWSYMDARQKYRSLVRRTADRFRRAAAA